MKQLKYTLFLLIGILFSCSDDEFFIENESNFTTESTDNELISSSKFKMDSLENAKFLDMKFFGKLDQTSKRSSSPYDLGWGEIQVEESIQVVDNKGFRSTSFKVNPFEERQGVLYNLVVIEKDELTSVHIFGYKTDRLNEDFDDGIDLDNFSGEIISQQLQLNEGSNIPEECYEYISDLLIQPDNENTGGGSSGVGDPNGGSLPSDGQGSSGGWFTDVGGSVGGGDASSYSPIDWSFVGDVGGAIGGAVGGAVGAVVDAVKDAVSDLKRIIRSFCGCKKRPLQEVTAGAGLSINYLSINPDFDIDIDHDCFPAVVGIIQGKLDVDFLAQAFSMDAEEISTIIEDNPELFISMVAVIKQGGYNETAANLLRELILAINNEHISVENAEKLIEFLNNNFSQDSLDFALELLEIMEGNLELSFVDSIITLKGQKLNIDIALSEYLEFENDYKQQMSQSEIAIFETLNLYQQASYLINAYVASKKAIDLYPGQIHNRLGDAYRHALWNALCTFDLGLELTESLTTAHEDTPSNYTYNYKEDEMDLFNNDKGRQIAFNYSENLPIFSPPLAIFDLIEQAVSFGYLRYLNNLDSNNLATENSELIPTNQ